MFRVHWLQQALDELTNIWLAGDTALRSAVTAAAHAIDQQLQADPYRASESRGNDERVLFVYPLGVQIEIDLANGIVWILNVWRFRRRGA